MTVKSISAVAGLALTLALVIPASFTRSAVGQENPTPRQERPRGEGRREGPGGPGGPGGSIEGAMKMTNRALKTLSDQIGDAAKKRENLKLICDAQRGIATAKALPLGEKFTKSAADETAKNKLADDTRHELTTVLKALLDIETAIEDGKLDVAKTKLDSVKKLRDDAHKRLGVEED